MKNYYEILEVDKNASQEIIEKAYKTLAKKYHPDLQQGIQKQEYAEKMKNINEAYDVLSNNFRREQYDQELNKQQQKTDKAEQERILKENYELKQQLNRIKNNNNSNNNEQVDNGSILNITRVIEQQIKSAQRQAYNDAYIQDMKNRGYKIKYKHDLKYYFKLCIVIFITFLVLFLVYQIPIIKEFFQNLYKENILFRAIVDVFVNTFSSKF